MRSFSIVLAWFFACLVVLIGEVQEVGDITMCRYRKFGKDFRPIMKGYKMAENRFAVANNGEVTDVASNQKKVNAAVDLRSATRTPMKSRRRFKEGGSGFARSRNINKSSLDSQRFEQKGITGINAFYPVVPALRPELAVKYPVSHYEVHLDFGPKVFITGAGLVAYENEINPAALETTVRLGGEEFHKKVWAAALEANKQFTTINTIDPKGLCNAFYYLLYNARQAYSLMLTALRSQLSVNAQDEDNVWLSPLLNQHRYIPMNFRDAGYSNGYWTTHRYNQTHFDTNFNRQNTDGGSFTSAISNAHWAQLWSTLASFMRLPHNWKQWCKDMFLSYKVVSPTDYCTTPRFVVFWPDGGYDSVTVNQGSVVQTHKYLTRWYNLSNGNQPIVEWNNADISGLELLLEECSATFNILMSVDPQLEIMFDILGCTSDLEVDFTRDLLGKTLLIDKSWDVEKLIYSSAMPFAAMLNSSQSAVTTYVGEPLQDRVALPQYWIRKDPLNTFASSDPRNKMLSLSNIQYVDATTINEANMLLLYHHLAPLSQIYFRATNNGVALTDFQYVFQPLNHYNTVYSCADSVNNLHTVVAKHAIVGHELLEAVNTAVTVKPRMVSQAKAYGSPSSGNVLFYLECGALPVLQDADNQVRSFEMFAMSDYQIPDLTALEAINDYLDHLSS